MLARLRDVRCQATVETIGGALTGNYRPEHVFALQQSLELYDVYQEKIRSCDDKIEAALRRLHDTQKNESRFDIRSALHTLLGVDLAQIHGLGPYAALKLVSECGNDMSRWPTAKHFTSVVSPLRPAARYRGVRC